MKGTVDHMMETHSTRRELHCMEAKVHIRNYMMGLYMKGTVHEETVEEEDFTQREFYVGIVLEGDCT